MFRSYKGGTWNNWLWKWVPLGYCMRYKRVNPNLITLILYWEFKVSWLSKCIHGQPNNTSWAMKLLRLCSATKMSSKAISEHLIFKNFLGEHPPDPSGLACLLAYTYIHTYIHTMATKVHCPHTYIHTFIHAYMHTCIHTHTPDIHVIPLQNVLATGLCIMIMSPCECKWELLSSYSTMII